MIYQMLSLTLPILIFGAFGLHVYYLRTVHTKIQNLKGGGKVPYDEFYENMTVAQGSNFCGLATSAWIMLAVAIAYFFILIPGNMPYSYMTQMPDLASSQIGFIAFGVIVSSFAMIVILISDSLPESWRNLKLTEIYSFYVVSKNMKRNIGLTIPPLGLSVLLSAYSGTIYPERFSLGETLSFILLLSSTVVLVWPVLVGRK